ncbi:MAG: pullulanase [Candidatus Promineifilaceae bacterium]|jgi:pullulanase
MSRQPHRRFLPLIVIFLGMIGLGLFFLLTRDTKAPARQPEPPHSVQEMPTVVRLPAGGIVLRADFRAIPGVEPTRFLKYEHPGAEQVSIFGSWNGWGKAASLAAQGGGLFALDIADLNLKSGPFAYKFVVDDQWEADENRRLYINANGQLERPADLIVSAKIQTPKEIVVILKPGVSMDGLDIQITPDLPIKKVRWAKAKGDARLTGVSVAGDTVMFTFYEDLYAQRLSPDARVAVAGNFNGWRTDGGPLGSWLLNDADNDDVWTLTTQLPDMRLRASTDPYIFKFVVNNETWLRPSMVAPNAFEDENGITNLRIDPAFARLPVLTLELPEPIALDQQWLLSIQGAAPRPAFCELTPGAIFETFSSQHQLGPVWAEDKRSVDLSLFAPRASRAVVGIASQSRLVGAAGHTIEPERVIDMQRTAGGIWRARVDGVEPGAFYAFRVDGATGTGEGFIATEWFGDPYARANAHAKYASILIDPDAKTPWFAGWTDQDFRAPAWKDVVIYETHIRDLTAHASSKVPDELRGTFAGVLATEGTGQGLDHLKSLGVNMIEFLPLQEFHNPGNTYDWGYATAFYFAPESSYGRDPTSGAHYYEMKHFVNALHERGFGVIMDVVYNHVGSPNVFALTDRKYFFRLDTDFRYLNFSGFGNDVRTEAAMMRRLIVENVLYWVQEFHVDGFRFDLGELIDMETMLAVRDAVRRIHPNILLISEPWSFRGTNKDQLTGTRWAAWNDDFREGVKAFALGYGSRNKLKQVISGSVGTFAATPMQSVNYLESHDGRTLVDELTGNPGHDGRRLTERDAARNRLAATVLFTSFGIPMLAEGQAFLRSKRGIKNSFDKGDAVNALNWSDRDRPMARQALTYYQGLATLRASHAGQTFRLAGAVPDGYVKWIEPPTTKALGYVVNADARYPGRPFIVILNSDDVDLRVSVLFSQGEWMLVGDGVRVDTEGLRIVPGTTEGDRKLNLKVPPLTSLIFMRR